MNCLKCGYALEAFETQCPRCRDNDGFQESVQLGTQKCWFCKSRLSDEPKTIQMHKGNEERQVVIPRCSNCASHHLAMARLWAACGCLGSIIVFVIILVTGDIIGFSRKLAALIALSPMLLLLFAVNVDKAYRDYPLYKQAVRDGFVEGNQSTTTVNT